MNKILKKNEEAELGVAVVSVVYLLTGCAAAPNAGFEILLNPPGE